MADVGPVKRVTLWVRDLDASLALYRDLLGLDVIEDKTLEGPAVRSLLGIESGRLRIVHLASGSANHGWIGLYALSDAVPAMPSLAPSDTGRFSLGQAVIVFDTQRLEPILERLAAGGYPLLGQPIDYVKPAGSGPTPAGRYREVVFFDPDGVPVSVIQFDPA